MIPVRFDSKTSPWRVFVPARFNNGKRKVNYFQTKDAAAAYCKELKNKGPGALTNYVAPIPKTQSDQMETAIRWALTELGDFRKLYDAVEHFKLTRLNVKPATIREAVEAFQAYRRTVKSERTVSDDGSRLAKLINYFPDIQLSEIAKPQLIEFFDSLRKTHKDVLTIYKSVHVFFVWALERGYIGQMPFEKGTRKTFGQFGVNNEFYPVDTFRRMLRIAAGLEPAGQEEKPTRDFADLLPWFVLSGFAGLRSCEAFRTNLKRDSLKWTDLYFAGVDEPHIQLSGSVAKGGRPRPVDMAPALEAIQTWLAFCPRGNGEHIIPVTSRTIVALKTEFTKRTGIKFKANGFRNSFATYALAYSTLKGLGYVSKQMGDSEAICKRHYAQNLPTGAGKRWFEGIRPDEPANVVPMSAAA
jgi:integrase